MQNAVAATSRTCSTSGRPHLAVAPASAACAWRQRRHQQRSVTAQASVQLEDLEGKMHTLEVSDGETILDVALDAGVELPYDCKMGVCLRCSARMKSGKVDQPGGMISEEGQEEGYALLCVAYPQGDCSVQAIPEGELVDVLMNIT
ncbi:hypothetical protein D9Q98_007026 [Chlorella vulgaris]|uniref:2Fe-2S ferredoxin-type domain-containing protein n=1 Tax=Chlorella vulgaris TaxID=3077 RepID=A0A9D4TJC1_CHLVU|nr:hypothetical protein D9Q98_007026 [Chlorella vulgaris]